MKLKKKYPNKIILTDKDPMTVNILINVMKNLGIEVPNGSSKFDPKYPYVGFNYHIIDLWENIDNNAIKVNTIQEFVSHFVEDDVVEDIEIGDYMASVRGDEIIVGCQTIPFETVEKVYNTMLKIKSM